MTHPTKKISSPLITRREFAGQALTTAGVIAGAPAFLRGQNLNNKLNIAFIACGGRANASLAELTIVPGAAGAEPQEAHFRTGGPEVPHPDENVAVICDINQIAIDSASQRYPQAKKFTDLRRVFDRPNDFDAVVVSTAEHTHAFATYLALTHGKHVYCEKPLAYNIWETRLIRETAAKYPKLSTQMGNQGHASAARRTIREILDTGVIGPVREVHVWADRAWGLAGRRVRREVRQAARVLQRHPDRRPLQGGDARPAERSTGTCGSAPRRSGRSMRRISPARAGIDGGISATAR